MAAEKIACPACRYRADYGAAPSAYEFARAHLCATDQARWDAADERAHARGNCPHAPRPCPRGVCA